MKNLFKPTNYIDSWTLTKITLEFFLKHKALNCFPIAITLITSLFLLSGCALLVASFSLPTKLIIFFISYLFFILVSTYLNAACTAMLLRKLQGQSVSLIEGFKAANRNIGHLIVWSLLSNSVGLFAKLLDGPLYLLTQLISYPRENSWKNAAYFALPVLITEHKKPFAAMQRSIDIVGRGYRSTVSIKELAVILFIFCLLILNEFVKVNPVETMQAVLFLAPILLMTYVIASFLENILSCALYLNIAKQKNPQHFDQTLLNRVFVKEHL